MLLWHEDLESVKANEIPKRSELDRLEPGRLLAIHWRLIRKSQFVWWTGAGGNARPAPSWIVRCPHEQMWVHRCASGQPKLRLRWLRLIDRVLGYVWADVLRVCEHKWLLGEEGSLQRKRRLSCRNLLRWNKKEVVDRTVLNKDETDDRSSHDIRAATFINCLASTIGLACCRWGGKSWKFLAEWSKWTHWINYHKIMKFN